MRTFFILITGLLFLSGPAFARQESPAPKYWVFFRDKPSDDAAKATRLLERTRIRRQRRGKKLSASLDAPVSDRYLARLRDLGVEPLVRSRWLNAVSARLDARARDRVAALPFVRAIRRVASTRPHAPAPTAPIVAAQPVPANTAATRRLDYGLSEQQLATVNDVAPLERGINGAGIRVGFLDTGVGDLSGHPAFARMLAEGRLIASQDFTGLPDDGSRHARAVISVATGFEEGQLVGPAYAAEVLHARTEYTPTETNQEEDNFVAGLEWLESMGVDVVNSSLGYSTFDAGERSYTYEDMDGDTPVTTRVADLATQLGVVFVTSAGNEGGCGLPSPTCWFYITSPADGDSVITVGAVDVSGQRSSFSSFGPTADGRIKPDVAAQGRTVYLANSDTGYGFSQGTSFSGPMVTGIVAQMLQVNPNLTPIQVRDLLRQTASQAAAPDSILGWGIVDADAAILAAEALVSGVEDAPPAPDAGRMVIQAYPNPSTDLLTFEVEAGSRPYTLHLAVYDLLGREVVRVFDGPLHAGTNRIVFHTGRLTPGIYLYQATGGGVHHTGKLVRLP